ncbi:hypothetical protein C0J52_08543 [Blattella germanica]|nr:hypothetical protein C0J52_08543 [Blattella germanica]
MNSGNEALSLPATDNFSEQYHRVEINNFLDVACSRRGRDCNFGDDGFGKGGDNLLEPPSADGGEGYVHMLQLAERAQLLQAAVGDSFGVRERHFLHFFAVLFQSRDGVVGAPVPEVECLHEWPKLNAIFNIGRNVCCRVRRQFEDRHISEALGPDVPLASDTNDREVPQNDLHLLNQMQEVLWNAVVHHLEEDEEVLVHHFHLLGNAHVRGDVHLCHGFRQNYELIRWDHLFERQPRSCLHVLQPNGGRVPQQQDQYVVRVGQKLLMHCGRPAHLKYNFPKSLLPAKKRSSPLSAESLLLATLLKPSEEGIFSHNYNTPDSFREGVESRDDNNLTPPEQFSRQYNTPEKFREGLETRDQPVALTAEDLLQDNNEIPGDNPGMFLALPEHAMVPEDFRDQGRATTTNARMSPELEGLANLYYDTNRFIRFPDGTAYTEGGPVYLPDQNTGSGGNSKEPPQTQVPSAAGADSGELQVVLDDGLDALLDEYDALDRGFKRRERLDGAAEKSSASDTQEAEGTKTEAPAPADGEKAEETEQNSNLGPRKEH